MSTRLTLAVCEENEEMEDRLRRSWGNDGRIDAAEYAALCAQARRAATAAAEADEAHVLGRAVADRGPESNRAQRLARERAQRKGYLWLVVPPIPLRPAGDDAPAPEAA